MRISHITFTMPHVKQFLIVIIFRFEHWRRLCDVWSLKDLSLKTIEHRLQKKLEKIPNNDEILSNIKLLLRLRWFTDGWIDYRLCDIGFGRFKCYSSWLPLGIMRYAIGCSLILLLSETHSKNWPIDFYFQCWVCWQPYRCSMAFTV